MVEAVAPARSGAVRRAGGISRGTTARRGWHGKPFSLSMS
jgi:hypothetical protein